MTGSHRVAVQFSLHDPDPAAVRSANTHSEAAVIETHIAYPAARLSLAPSKVLEPPINGWRDDGDVLLHLSKVTFAFLADVNGPCGA